ncbi:hypothetical protein NLG97_g10049 [Lecanicillium saksenae]|uniref:Uncharacterized protein n=1 Tax=Lecanicillium saksenae TaxID=468837 RepID=A0ACC1QFK8_9HYPO|nr:hypothetical protein NLG97_g10049 [Lecanicillium saksenae]
MAATHRFDQRELEAIRLQPISNHDFRKKAKKIHELMAKEDPKWTKVAAKFLIHHFIESEVSQHVLTKDRTTDVQNGLYQLVYNMKSSYAKHMVYQFLHLSTEKDHARAWAEVIDMIHEVTMASQLTGDCPPPRLTSHRFPEGTGRDTLEASIFDEIRDHVYKSVPGFMERHFSNVDEDMITTMLKNYDTVGKEWRGFPKKTTENEVFKFCQDLLQKCCRGAPNSLHQSISSGEFKDHKSQVDFFFKPRLSESTSKYADIFVVGEHKETYWNNQFKPAFSQLSRYARFVYCEQPLRAFVHAFTIQGPVLELWIYDRSGAYSSGHFSIHLEPERFARALVGYATMRGQDMGQLDIFQKTENGNTFIELQSLSVPSQPLHVPVLEQIFHQNAILCRGTTCFSTPLGVLKLSWCPDDRRSELDNLLQAKKRGVAGVATAVAFKDIASMRIQRTGMEFLSQSRHAFRNLSAQSPNWSPEASPKASPKSTSKRGSREIPNPITPSAKRRSLPSRSKSLATSGPTSPTGPSSPAAVSKDIAAAVASALQGAAYSPRVLTAILITPQGKAVGHFDSAGQLLRVLKDATEGHKSLFENGILHCDISTNNIIITEPSRNDNFHGMLIDLDMAKDLTEEEGGNKGDGPTGTVQFISYNVLLGKKHTFVDDLESFLYVLIWLCSQDAWDKPQIRGDEKTPHFNFAQKWTRGTLQDIAYEKLAIMSELELFREVLRRFPASLKLIKPVCLEIRHVLHKSGSKTPQEVYDGIFRAYERGIASLEE